MKFSKNFDSQIFEKNFIFGQNFREISILVKFLRKKIGFGRNFRKNFDFGPIFQNSDFGRIFKKMLILV